MKKIKALFVVMFFTLLLTGCSTNTQANTTTQTATIQNQKSKSLNSYSRLVQSGVSRFTGRNFAVLPKNTKIPATVNRIVDGDTIVFAINNQSFKTRILLMDTPESVKPNTPVQPFAKDASNYTKKIMTSTKQIELEFDKGDRTDHYHRALVHVFYNGKLLAQTIIQAGLARVAYIFPPSTTYLTELQAAQAAAKKAKKGIWSISGYVTDRGFDSSAAK